MVTEIIADHIGTDRSSIIIPDPIFNCPDVKIKSIASYYDRFLARLSAATPYDQMRTGLSEVKRVMVPGGKGIITLDLSYLPSNNSYTDFLTFYTRDEMANILDDHHLQVSCISKNYSGFRYEVRVQKPC